MADRASPTPVRQGSWWGRDRSYGISFGALAVAAGLGVSVFWNVATLGGALLGDARGDPQAWGLDGAALVVDARLAAAGVRALGWG